MDFYVSFKQQFFIGNPENNFSNRQLASLNTCIILNGDTPRMLDEWQEVPSLWDAVRYEVDKRGLNGQFILTGSSTPKIKCVICGLTNAAYIRDDGVYVVPLIALKDQLCNKNKCKLHNNLL